MRVVDPDKVHVAGAGGAVRAHQQERRGGLLTQRFVGKQPGDRLMPQAQIDRTIVQSATEDIPVVEECGDCHGDLYTSYRGSFHGKATHLGMVTSATCSAVGRRYFKATSRCVIPRGTSER